MLDMPALMAAFQDFWRENATPDSFVSQNFHEAYPYFVLQAFLQRVINGGGCETVLDTVSAEECSGCFFDADRRGYFFTEGEVDPLRYAGRPNFKKIHILLLGPGQKMHSAHNHPKVVFRLAIAPDLLKERGIK